MRVLRYKRIPSTNLTAHALAKEGAAEWTVVVSEVQTRGRGLRGRKWESRKGGLWFSVILRPKLPPGKVSLLQFLASNATRKATMKKTGVRVQAKWPNDLVVRSGKLAGILVESKSIGDTVAHVIVGIGLNVNQGVAQLPAGATSLRLSSGRTHWLPGLLRAIVENMKSDYGNLGNPEKILDEWWANCVHRPVRVEVDTRKGRIAGISLGIDPEGSLLVETDKHVVEKIVEGTLRLRES